MKSSNTPSLAVTRPRSVGSELPLHDTAFRAAYIERQDGQGDQSFVFHVVIQPRLRIGSSARCLQNGGARIKRRFGLRCRSGRGVRCGPVAFAQPRIGSELLVGA